jgi:hypothetical protein
VSKTQYTEDDTVRYLLDQGIEGIKRAALIVERGRVGTSDHEKVNKEGGWYTGKLYDNPDEGLTISLLLSAGLSNPPIEQFCSDSLVLYIGMAGEAIIYYTQGGGYRVIGPGATLRVDSQEAHHIEPKTPRAKMLRIEVRT